MSDRTRGPAPTVRLPTDARWPADSRGRRNTAGQLTESSSFSEMLGWGFPAGHLSWSAVESGGHHLHALGPRSGNATGAAEGIGRSRRGVAGGQGAVAARQMYEHQTAGEHSTAEWRRAPGCNVPRRSYTECLAIARHGLAHAATTAVEQPFVHPAGSVTVRPAPGPRSHEKDGLVHRRPLHRQNIDHHSSRPPRQARPIPLQGAKRPIPTRLECMAEERRPRSGKSSTTAARRKRCLPKRGGAIRKRAPHTSSCVLRARCAVATSSPLQALTFRLVRV